MTLLAWRWWHRHRDVFKVTVPTFDVSAHGYYCRTCDRAI